MARPNQYKDVEKEGKTFRIRKFTPEIASYWGFQLFGDLAAFGVSVGGTDKVAEKLPKLIKDFTRMGRQQFQEFQKDCLSFVDVKFDLEGFAPLVNSEGFITSPDISNPVLFELTTESFLFTIQDFFAQWVKKAEEDSSNPAPSGPTSKPETGSSDSSITP